jgi:hypothetical protein
MTDLDLLVPAEQAFEADRLLGDLGYAAVPPSDLSDHHLAPRWSEHPAVGIELHTALTKERWSPVLPASTVLDAAVDGRMTTTHAVVHSIAHGQLHHEGYRLGRLQLRRLYELAVVADSPRASEIDWNQVRHAFRRVRAESALDSHLYLARALFGAAVPAPPSRTKTRVHAALVRADPASTRLGNLRYWALNTPRAFAAGRMGRLYGPGNVWSHRLRHVLRRRLWRHLLERQSQ